MLHLSHVIFCASFLLCYMRMRTLLGLELVNVRTSMNRNILKVITYYWCLVLLFNRAIILDACRLSLTIDVWFSCSKEPLSWMLNKFCPVGSDSNWKLLHLLHSSWNDYWNNCHVPYRTPSIQKWDKQPSCSTDWRNTNSYADSSICYSCNWFTSTVSTGMPWKAFRI